MVRDLKLTNMFLWDFQRQDLVDAGSMYNDDHILTTDVIVFKPMS